MEKLIETDNMDVATILELKDMNERKIILSEHHYWQGNNKCWYTYISDASKKRGERLVKRKSKEAIEDFIITYYKNLKKVVTVDMVYRLWIQDKVYTHEITEATLTRYDTDFIRYFNPIKDLPINNITEELLDAFIKEIIHNRISKTAFRNFKVLLKGIFKFAKKSKLTTLSISYYLEDLDISKKSFTNSKKKDEDEVFTVEEIEKIMSYIKENPTLINLGIALDFYTGLRAGELSALKWEDIDFKKGVINVCRTETKAKDELGHTCYYVDNHTKTYASERTVYLTDNAIALLKQIRALNPFGEYIFMTDEKGRNHSNTDISIKLNHRTKGKAFTVKLEKICKYVGIKPRSLHKVRKTYATMLLNSDVPEKLIQCQLGHTDIKTTQAYYYKNNFTEYEQKAIIKEAINI